MGCLGKKIEGSEDIVDTFGNIFTPERGTPIGRQWPPMAANGRQRPPMAANGRQWPPMAKKAALTIGAWLRCKTRRHDN